VAGRNFVPGCTRAVIQHQTETGYGPRRSVRTQNTIYVLVGDSPTMDGLQSAVSVIGDSWALHFTRLMPSISMLESFRVTDMNVCRQVSAHAQRGTVLAPLARTVTLR